MALFGYGDGIMETKKPIPSLGHTLMMELCFAQLAVATQPTEVKARCRDKKTGLLVTKRTGLSEIVHTVTLTLEHTDWKHMGFLHDEIPADAATSINRNKEITVPSSQTAPYEVTDPDITATNAEGVRAYVSEKGTWGDAIYLKRVNAAPANKKEFQVNGATGKIIFHQDLKGARILYKLDEPYTAIQTIGETETWEAFGDVQLWFTAYGEDDFAEGLVYHFEQLVRTAAPPVFNYDQSPITATIAFEARSSKGRKFPYEIYNAEYSTAA
jgi:hypothetical protein